MNPDKLFNGCLSDKKNFIVYGKLPSQLAFVIKVIYERVPPSSGLHSVWVELFQPRKFRTFSRLLFIL